MNLELLLARSNEIASAIATLTNQLNALHGHKAETDHWISQMQPPKESNETQVETQDVPVVE